MQFLVIFGIYKEAYKVIMSGRKFFSQITLALILPLSFFFLAHMEVTDLLHRNFQQRHFTRITNSARYKLSHVISADRTLYWFFQATYLTFYLILSLFPTSAVVYTLACYYTHKELSFKKLMSVVVPKVWKRLVVTFLYRLVAYFAYNVVAIMVIIIWGVSIGDTRIGDLIFYIIIAFYLVGYFYLNTIWHLACIVSVLEEEEEDSCGFGAMIKSRALVEGLKMVTGVIFFVQNASLFVIQRMFQKVVVVHDDGWSPPVVGGTVSRVVCGIICLVLLLKLMLFGLVIQSVIYFVCKSYHHEDIDYLSDHLEVYSEKDYAFTFRYVGNMFNEQEVDFIFKNFRPERFL